MHRVLLLSSPLSLTAQTILEDTVVTASRLEERADEAPQATEVISEERFIEQSFRTVPEAFALTPGVSVQKTTHGQGSPFIRGFTGRQNLYLIDGIRFNNSTFRSGPIQYANTIDGFWLEQLELVKSQGSVLYGSDALGGTLNAITPSSGYRDESGFFQRGNIPYRYNTNSQSHVGRLEQTIGVGKKWGLTFGTTVKDFGDVRSNFFGRMEGTGYTEQNIDGKLEFSLSDNLHLTLAHQQINQDDINRWHSTTANPGGWEGLDAGEFAARVLDQERSLSYLKIEGEPLGGLIDSYTATPSYQTSQDSEFQDRSNPNPLLGAQQLRFANINTDTYKASLEAQSTLQITTLLYGADHYEDRVNSDGSRVNTLTNVVDENRAPIADDSVYRSLGLFAQARTTWSDQLETTLGLRYTYAQTDIGSLDTDDSCQALVFNARALYRLNDTWTTFGGYSQGFRAPNLNDLTGSVTSRSGLDSLGSLGLDPERSHTFEIGTHARHDRFSFEASGFYTFVDDLIVRIEDSAGTERSRNAAQAWITGLELEGRYAFNDNWSLNGFVAWQYGNQRRPETLGDPDSTVPVSRLPPSSLLPRSPL